MAAATSKMKCFVIIVNSFQRSILDVAAALDPPLETYGPKNLRIRTF